MKPTHLFVTSACVAGAGACASGAGVAGTIPIAVCVVVGCVVATVVVAAVASIWPASTSSVGHIELLSLALFEADGVDVCVFVVLCR